MDEELIKRMDALLNLAKEQRINIFDLGDLLFERYNETLKVTEFSSEDFCKKAEMFLNRNNNVFYQTCFRGKQLQRSIKFLTVCYQSMYEQKNEETFAERKKRERQELAKSLGLKITTVQQYMNFLLKIIEACCNIMYPDEFKKFKTLPLSKRRVVAEEFLIEKILEDEVV